MKRHSLYLGLVLLGSLAAYASPIITVQSVNTNMTSIAGGSLPVYAHFWQAMDGSDATSPAVAGLRFRGATCVDGTLENCGGFIPMPPLQIYSPFTMRLTDMVFSCDFTGGCDAFDFLFIVDMTFDTANALFTPTVDWHISGCTLSLPSINGEIPTCPATPSSNTFHIAYYFSFDAFDESGNIIATREFGSSGFDSDFLIAQGNFSYGGTGIPLPVVRRYQMTIGGRIGGAPTYSGDGGFDGFGPWTGAILFPGSIGASINLTPTSSEIPEPGTMACVSAGMAIFVWCGRRSKTRR